MAQGILSGIQVIDMATYIFGPASTTVMSDFGAEVIKIESPGYWGSVPLCAQSDALPSQRTGLHVPA